MSRLSCILTIINIALVCVFAEELYTDQYDDIDVQSILENDKLRTQYYDCFMESGPCTTAVAKFFKAIFGEAIQTNCRKCTEKQKEHLNTIVDWYTNNQPEQWQKIIEKSLEEMKKKNAGQ